MITWTPELLNLPAALARLWARKAGAGHDIDELECVAGLAVAEAAAEFDPGRGASAATWLYGKAWWALRAATDPTRNLKERRFWRRVISLDAPAPGSDRPLRDVLEGSPDAGPAPEELAALAAALTRLDGRARQVLRLLYWEGLSRRTAARHLTMREADLRRLEAAALDRLRESLRGRPAA